MPNVPALSNEETLLLEGLPVKREKRKPVRRTRRVLTLEGHLRRAVALEIGADEDVPREEHFQLLEKFGVTQPRFTKNVKKPKWMEESEWKAKSNKLAQWFPSKTIRPKASNPNHRTSKPWSQIRDRQGRTPSNPNFTKTFKHQGTQTGRLPQQSNRLSK